MHYIALHCIKLHYTPLYCITLHYIALHCITLHYIAFHCITLHYIALHCIISHTYLQTCTHIDTYTHTYVHAYAHAHIQAHPHTFIHAFMHAYILLVHFIPFDSVRFHSITYIHTIADRQTNRHAARQTGKPTDKQTASQPVWYTHHTKSGMYIYIYTNLYYMYNLFTDLNDLVYLFYLITCYTMWPPVWHRLAFSRLIRASWELGSISGSARTSGDWRLLASAT